MEDPYSQMVSGNLDGGELLLRSCCIVVVQLRLSCRTVVAQLWQADAAYNCRTVVTLLPCSCRSFAVQLPHNCRTGIWL